jgi:hypothetical protein
LDHLRAPGKERNRTQESRVSGHRLDTTDKRERARVAPLITPVALAAVFGIELLVSQRCSNRRSHPTTVFGARSLPIPGNVVARDIARAIVVDGYGSPQRNEELVVAPCVIHYRARQPHRPWRQETLTVHQVRRTERVCNQGETMGEHAAPRAHTGSSLICLC